MPRGPPFALSGPHCPHPSMRFALLLPDLAYPPSTHALVPMTSAPHVEGRQFDPSWVSGKTGDPAQGSSSRG
eukprot:11115616-Lingulodinium_polyedra.AAC.1